MFNYSFDIHNMQNKNKITNYSSSHYAMPLNQKQIALLTTVGVLIVVVIPVVYLFLLALSPLTFDEMDFDDNGFVTFSELIHANSNCHRLILNGQVICDD